MAREKAKSPNELSVEEKLKNLYSLQMKLSEIDRIKTLRGELPLEVQDLEDEIEGLTIRVEKINADIVNMKREISERKGAIEVNNTNIERFKTQMNDVRNNREYDSLSKQIEYLELDNALNEKKISEANERIQTKNQDLVDSHEAMQERRTDLDIKKSELDEIISETKAEEEKLREEAKGLECTIEPRLLSAFKRIRKNSRNGLAVVYIQRDACGGCFNKIPPQRQLDIRMRKKIIVCENCGRIVVDAELAGIVPAGGAVVEEKTKRRRTIRSKKEE